MRRSRLFENPDRGRVSVPAPDGSPIEFHRSLPGYRPTALLELPAMARRLGVGRVLVKTETERFGLPSFKILGASWAVYRKVLAHTGIELTGGGTLADLATMLTEHGPLRLATATDGNHGRAVARMARWLGLRATIWVPDAISPSRLTAIRAEGAEVEIVHGTYDQAVESAAASATESTLVVSDTSWPGYEEVPGWVMDGYTTILEEADGQLGGEGLGTVDCVPVPMGVGSLASAVILRLARVPRSPTVVGVEPLAAACVEAALRAGDVVEVDGDLETAMVGLSCGKVSAAALPVLRRGLTATVSIPDEWAVEAVRMYADAGVETCETGAAALAGVLSLLSEHQDRLEDLGLGPEATLLLPVTEGPTDPIAFERIVGRRPEPNPTVN